MPLIIPSNSISAGGFAVDNSLRFNTGSSDYLTRTPASATDRQKFTISAWCKRGDLRTDDSTTIFSAGSTSVSDGYLVLNWDYIVGNALVVQWRDGGSNGFKRTTQVFRDVSAWYHIVVAVDTTQASNSNRMKIYVNGTQVTSFSTDTTITQNRNFLVNSTVPQRFGAQVSGGGSLFGYINAYLSEVCLIDGTQNAVTDFGEFDEDSGIWKPIDVSGLTFGTNGFYLPFENSAALGQDDSGNGNNFTVNNLTAIDQTTDTPTNNFCTLNPLILTASYTFSEGNCKLVTSGSDSTGGGIGTIGVSQGKWFWELKLLSGNMGNHTHGIISEFTNTNQSALQNKVGVTQFRNDDGGEMVKDGTQTSADYGTFSTGDIMGVALNADDNQISIYKNGSVIVSNFTISTTRGILFPLICMGINCETQCNFGNAPYAISSGNTDGNGYGNFEYAVPSGYYALNTKNLAEYG